MGKTRVILEISPTRLELATLRGDSIADRRAIRLSLPTYAEQWPDVLSGLDKELASLVADLKATGANATILYASPTAATAVLACADAAGTAGVQKAARLALAEATGFPLDQNPCDLQRLTTDKPADPAVAPQAHTLGIADTEATAKALADFVARAGLIPGSLLPIDVPGTIAAADAALRLATDSVALVLYAGEHGSTLAAASPGRLRFIRHIAIGTESLIAALAREYRPAPEGPAVTLDAAAAADLLMSTGIPERGRPFDPARGIMADAVLPVIQPILQRCVVDIKQSLRFGLEEKERETAKLHGLGPGAAMPRLIQLIAMQAGLKLAESAITSAGAIQTWTEGRRLPINLLPRDLRSQMTGRRVRRALWAGVGVALAVVATDAARTRMSLSEQQRTSASLKQQLEAAKPATAIQEKLIGAKAGLDSARQRAAAKLDTTGAWDGVMAMIGTHTPAGIRLTQIHFTFEAGKPVCRLAGHARIAAGGEANTVLRQYMDDLSAVPMVRACRLGATQRGESDRGTVQNFEMTLLLVELPATPRPPAASLTEAVEETP